MVSGTVKTHIPLTLNSQKISKCPSSLVLSLPEWAPYRPRLSCIYNTTLLSPMITLLILPTQHLHTHSPKSAKHALPNLTTNPPTPPRPSPPLPSSHPITQQTSPQNPHLPPPQTPPETHPQRHHHHHPKPQPPTPPRPKIHRAAPRTAPPNAHHDARMARTEYRVTDGDYYCGSDVAG